MTRAVWLALQRFGERLARGEHGQALMEEALILVLIGVIAIGALTSMQGSIADTFGQVAGSLSLMDTEDAPTGR